jgi:parvulin-like peptidyl-prolyl isomerase
VEPLDSALTRLKVGEVTEVLDTEFGVQLMRLEEIQDQGVVPFEEARREIEPRLRQQRGEERYRQWMSTLRKRSNVRVFL